MKQEYDFKNAEQAKFYRPLHELDLPIYLDDEVKAHFLKLLKDKKTPAQSMKTSMLYLKKT